MSEFLVPYARSGGRVWTPEEAQKGARYTCPCCESDLVLKKGDVKAHHFAHKANGSCSPESVLHKSAKLLIVQNFLDWRAGNEKKNTKVVRPCRICRKESPQQFYDGLDDAKVEQWVGKYRIDVGFYSEKRLTVGVEVCVTNGVSQIKQEEMSIPFIEVSGRNIVDNPLLMRPTMDRLPESACDKCNSIVCGFFARAKSIAKISGTDIMIPPYRFAIVKCKRCSAYILWYRWPVVFRGYGSSKPKTISVINGSAFNTCPFCGLASAAGAVYQEQRDSDGPFYEAGMAYGSSEKDIRSNFQYDMERISGQYARLVFRGKISHEDVHQVDHPSGGLDLDQTLDFGS